MEYEYVALKCSTSVWSHDRGFASAYCRLREQGWEEHLRAHFEKYDGGACIMRRPKDEPRKWTEEEIREIARGTESSVLNERAMQADLCGRLERRNAELLEAIDQVVCAARAPWDDAAIPTLRTVHRVFYPLATKKEESAGARGKDVKKGYNPPPADLRLPRKPPPPPPTKEDSNG